MKFIFSTILSSCLLVSCISNSNQTEVHLNNDENTYDSLKAVEYGADDYGMKTYVMAFLMKGSNRTLDSLEKQRLQNAHMSNIGRMAEEGKLILAGPFYGNDSLRGVYVFDTNSLDSARKWTQSDPAIQQQSLKMELKLWYGSAALMGINKSHQSLSKRDI